MALKIMTYFPLIYLHMCGKCVSINIHRSAKSTFYGYSEMDGYIFLKSPCFVFDRICTF